MAAETVCRNLSKYIKNFLHKFHSDRPFYFEMKSFYGIEKIITFVELTACRLTAFNINVTYF
jgi:hypothetical protein